MVKSANSVKKTPNKAYYKKNSKPKAKEIDWISALAKEASTASQATTTKILTKPERIEKRNVKKRRREERLGISASDNDNPKPIEKRQASPEELRMKAEYYLDKISQEVQGQVSRIQEGKSHKERRIAKPYIPIQEKGKATTGQQLSDEIIQPRKSDYGGLGLARPSLLLSLRDVSFIPKLEEEFAEHVVGFFGKQRTKAMKKQLDGDMLWRRLQKQKDGKKGGKEQNLNIKVDGKKLSDMSVDERVEAMIKLDMI